MRSHGSAAAMLLAGVLALGACAGEDTSPETDGDPTSAVEAPDPSAAPPLGGAPLGGAEQFLALQQEYAGIQQRLGPLQTRAMEDSAMVDAFAALENLLEEGMFTLDPEIPASRERLAALEGELSAAQAEGDTLGLQRLIQESTTLQGKIQRAQAQVLQQPEVFERVSAFQDSLLVRMTAMDPEARTLIERASAITTELQAAGR